MPEEKDPRPWVKLSVDYFRNLKVMCLSNDAKILHLTLIAAAAENRTNGSFPTPVCKQMGNKPFKELVDNGFLDPIPGGGYVIHDYDKHQTPSSDVGKLVEKRRAAGSAGGRKSAHVRNHERKGTTEHGCEFCHPGGPPMQSDGPIPF